MAGYSGTALVKKLGIKEGSKIFLAGAPRDYRRLVAPLPDGVVVAARMSGAIDLVHIFSVRRSHLHKTLRACLAKLKARRNNLGILAQAGIESTDRYYRRHHPRDRVAPRACRYQGLRRG